MSKGNNQDVWGGAILILVGAFAAIHSVTAFKLGTVSQMGPGFFPAALGSILTLLGALILIGAMLGTSERPKVDFSSAASVLVSLLAFALLIEPFGMVPAIVAQTLIASLADRKMMTVRSAAIVAAGLSLIAVLIFRIGLGMSIKVIAWPW